MSGWLRVYRIVLLLYPARFRREYSRDMVQFLADRLIEARKTGGRWLAARCWARAVLDAVGQGIRERFDGARSMTSARRLNPEPHGVARLAGVATEMRTTARSLRRTPLHTGAAVLTIALGIATATAMFSILRSVVLAGLPYPESDRMVFLNSIRRGAPVGAMSAADFVDVEERAKSFSALGAVVAFPISVTAGGPPERVMMAQVTAGFFGVLGVAPARGRMFDQSVGFGSDPAVVVLSDAYWRTRLGADPGVVGRTLQLGLEPYVVIGVMPPDFDTPFGSGVQLWTPQTWAGQWLQFRGRRNVTALARLAPGLAFEEARREIEEIGRQLAAEYPIDSDYELTIVDLKSVLIGDSASTVYSLFAAVFGIVLIACSNVANLLLAKGTRRSHEIALRHVLGAGRRRLAGVLLTESAMVATAGGVLGLLLAWGAVTSLRGVVPLPRADAAGLDAAVAAFAVGMTALTAILAGVLPAVRLSVTSPSTQLDSARGSTAGKSGRRAAGALVVTQFALAVLLVTGAALVLRSLERLHAVDLGIEPAGVYTFRVSFPGDRYDGDAVVAALDEIETRIEGSTGAEAAVTSHLPLTGQHMVSSFRIEGGETEPGRLPSSGFRIVTPDYFSTLGIPIVRGRPFEAADRRGAPLVAIINETAARSHFAGESPLGKRISFDGRDDERFWAEIVGVVADIRHLGPAQAPTPEIYQPHGQADNAWRWIGRTVTVVVRSPVAPIAPVDLVRAAVWEVDPALPIFQVADLETVLRERTTGPRFNAMMFAAFGGLALALAAVGVFGLLSFSVQQRTREIGIRMAMGAKGSAIIGGVMGEGLRLVGIGAGIGITAGLALNRFLAGLLFETHPLDPFAYAAGVMVLGLAAAAACYLPARQAAHLSPMESLRTE